MEGGNRAEKSLGTQWRMEAEMGRDPVSPEPESMNVVDSITSNVSKAPLVNVTVRAERRSHRKFQKGGRMPNPHGQW